MWARVLGTCTRTIRLLRATWPIHGCTRLLLSVYIFVEAIPRVLPAAVSRCLHRELPSCSRREKDLGCRGVQTCCRLRCDVLDYVVVQPWSSELRGDTTIRFMKVKNMLRVCDALACDFSFLCVSSQAKSLHPWEEKKNPESIHPIFRRPKKIERVLVPGSSASPQTFSPCSADLTVVVGVPWLFVLQLHPTCWEVQRNDRQGID